MSKERREAHKQEFNEEYGRNEVRTIPANPSFSQNVHEREEFVGPYCRVSTLCDEQVESYEIQKREYTKLIAEHPNWRMVDIYADEGISATSTKNRRDFLRLIEDCKAHKVTLILTKSVTRFARNTVDCISICRELKALNPPVGVFFETENIFTLDQNSEMMLNIYATLAQSESESKSSSIKWGIRKRFQNGIPRIVDLYGYKRIKRTLTVDPMTSTVVKMIYQWYLTYHSIPEIIRMLKRYQVASPHGNDIWTYSTILYILTNERYVGNVIMQKTVTVDVFTHRSVTNIGQAPKYEIENYHPPIIDKSDWETVQAMLMRYNWQDMLSSVGTLLDDELELLFVNLPTHILPRNKGVKNGF